MKKKVLGIIVVFVLIQFIRPEKNNSNISKNDISTVYQIPSEVKDILKTSCADCHSNSTEYPWYSEIAPISWFIAQHVNEGKEHLNFSEWTTYNDRQKNHIIEEMEEVLEEHEMPLNSYLLIHKNAKLSDNQYTVLVNWVKTLK
ncbi:heme-binding domain-containing protein [Lutibacter sp.]